MIIRQIYYVSAFLSAFMSNDIMAQIDLSQQVIGSAGMYYQYTGVYDISLTVGEAVINTVSSSMYISTQGLHQPNTTALLSFELMINDASCSTASDGSASLVNINGCTPPYFIFWSTGDQGVSVHRLLPGSYTVLVQSSQCSQQLEFEVGSGSEEFCVLRFFNAFSPNGDGKNDTWEIENIVRPEFSDNSVEIFNRWGQKVWTGSGYNNGDVVWNGKSSSENALPDGTYFYLVNVSGTVFKGFIDLTK